MKKSKFNLFVKEDDKNFLLYNSLTGSLSRVNNRLKDVMESEDLEAILPELNGKISKKLKQQGALIDDKKDELKEYSKMHERWKKGIESVEVNMLLTYDCNFACPYCYQGRGDEGMKLHGYKSMTQEMVTASRDFIKRTVLERGSRRFELVLYGGEPFLTPGVAEMTTRYLANWMTKRGIEFKLHALSNGSLITPDIVDWLSEYRARIQIPVDGDREIHNKYRFDVDTKEGSYDKVMDVLAQTKDTDIETHIRISLTDETCDRMESLLDDLKERGLTHVYPDFCYITAFTEACTDFKDHTLKDQNLFKLLPKLWEMAHEKGFPLDIRPQVQPLPCSSIADGSYIIDPSGDVYKCWEHVGLKEHIVGKLNNDGSMNKTEVYNDVLMRNPLEIKQCKGHNLLPTCGGGCVCKAYWTKGTYQAPGCGTEKFLLNDKIKVYAKTVSANGNKLLKAGSLEMRAIEGKQNPRISHCYVLV